MDICPTCKMEDLIARVQESGSCVDLSHSNITDDMLISLLPMFGPLDELNLTHTQITDIGVKALSQFP